jgi:hypothetical protein
MNAANGHQGRQAVVSATPFLATRFDCTSVRIVRMIRDTAVIPIVATAPEPRRAIGQWHGRGTRRDFRPNKLRHWMKHMTCAFSPTAIHVMANEWSREWCFSK